MEQKLHVDAQISKVYVGYKTKYVSECKTKSSPRSLQWGFVGQRVISIHGVQAAAAGGGGCCFPAPLEVHGI